MPKPKYIFKPKARQDVLEIAVHIARDNFAAAEAFLSAVENTCRNIAKTPAIGSRRSYVNSLLADVRMLPVGGFGGYLIFYRPLKTGIEVIRVIHGARDLPTLFA
jgi:toxin ParE1/3/4